MAVLATVGRWLGRIASLGALAFILLFAIGDGMHGKFTPRELAFLACLVIGLVGNLVAWRWEAIGAALALAALLGMTILQFAANQRLPGVWFFILLGIPAVLYVMSWLLRKNGVTGTV